MTIKTTYNNCNEDTPYLFDTLESSVKMTITFANNSVQIPTIQSKKQAQEGIINLIQGETNKIKWIAFAEIWIDINWILSGTYRQESDKSGDLDNITKPVLDSLTGIKGLFIDDTQVKAIYTCWFAKNEIFDENTLTIKCSFFNDCTLPKENLFFIQYANAMCTPINIDFDNINSIIGAKIFCKIKQKQRKYNEKIEKTGIFSSFYLVASQKDFHRTRLQAFKNNMIITIPQINQKILDIGYNFQGIISLLRKSKQ